MRKVVLFLLCLIAVDGRAQKSLEALLATLNSESIPYVTVDSLDGWIKKGEVLLLDSRERKEFDVSHIPGALYVGYRDFKIEQIEAAVKAWPGAVVVYCSLGVRSEDIAEKLIKVRKDGLYNLYGGIFEWVNTGHSIEDNQGGKTSKVHAYNRLWGVWLNKGDKIYE
jgi:rhodanese-related sulfurtransferase